MIAPARLIVLALAAAVIPSLGHAQQAGQTRSALSAGPRLEATATALRQTATPQADVVSMQRRQSQGQPVALMIVGGAAIVLGALIGDDIGTIFMIGGAVALLYGLYQYTK
jgi:hypothetical protein